MIVADSKAARELIRKLRKNGYVVEGLTHSRSVVVVGKRKYPIPGINSRTAGSAIPNAVARLRRAGINI